MTDTNKTIDELVNLINFYKTKADTADTAGAVAGAVYTGTEKADTETRFTSVKDNNADQELSIQGTKTLTTTFTNELTKAVDAKTTAETNQKKAEDDLKKKTEEVGNKLTATLITALEANPNKTDEIKAVIDELKTKGVNYVVDLSEVNKKIEGMRSEVAKKDNDSNNLIGIGGAIIGLVSLLLLGYSMVSNKKKETE